MKMRWPRSERAIRNIITAIHASKGNGQTLIERCRAKGISLSTYYRWRRWLRDEDAGVEFLNHVRSVHEQLGGKW